MAQSQCSLDVATDVPTSNASKEKNVKHPNVLVVKGGGTEQVKEIAAAMKKMSMEIDPGDPDCTILKGTACNALNLILKRHIQEKHDFGPKEECGIPLLKKSKVQTLNETIKHKQNAVAISDAHDVQNPSKGRQNVVDIIEVTQESSTTTIKERPNGTAISEALEVDMCLDSAGKAKELDEKGNSDVEINKLVETDWIQQLEMTSIRDVVTPDERQVGQDLFESWTELDPDGYQINEYIACLFDETGVTYSHEDDSTRDAATSFG